ncbi:MAG TPA: fimbria/pilus outer membrane usher protein [Burkholderiales bacterium]|nr:fimbria/pilus outer membrane usher protein [Burkholderiales bacterium]
MSESAHSQTLRLDRELKPPPAEQPSSRVAPPAVQEPSLSLKPERELSSAHLIPLEVFINGARAGDWVLLDVQGVLHATDEALREWRVQRAPEAESIDYLGQRWYPLTAVPGYAAQLNAANQSVNLKFSPEAFAATRLVQAAEERPEITPPLTAGFLNYDLSYTHTATRGAPDVQDLGALTELGISGAGGVLTNTSVARNLAGDGSLGPRTLTRLETTYARDFPQQNTSLRVGDSSTRAGSWGRSVYFGGVQLGTNYSLSPGFITQPIPVIAGQSSAPSTVELYVNDTLRQTSQVPTGPFTIENVPLLTGTGQARIVVRDLLGRETVVVQDFFTHTGLLRQGLTDWNVQAGAVRRNLGLESANYGEAFGSGLYRRGLTDNLTLEAQAEGTSTLTGAGIGLSTGILNRVLGQAAIAASHGDKVGTGYLWMLGAEHLSLRHNFTAHVEATDEQYRRVGQNDALPPYRSQVLLSYSYTTEPLGQVGLAYAHVNASQTGVVNSISANYSLRIGERASLLFSATRVSGPASGNAVGATLIIPLEGRLVASASSLNHGGHTDSYAGASNPLGPEAGFGWRALAGRRFGDTYGEGGLYYQGSRGLVTADASASAETQALRLGAQGGLVAVDGEFFASRKLQDSFALVEVPGYPDVGVGFQSTVLTRTDAEGKALVPRLIAYRRNSIRLDPNELPISAELDTIEIVAVPPARSGVRVAFPVRSGRGALIAIHLEDGEPAPAGAELELVGDTKEFFVARHGEAFVTGLRAHNTLRLKWKEQSCELRIDLPDARGDEIPRLGPVVCTGVKR